MNPEPEQTDFQMDGLLPRITTSRLTDQTGADGKDVTIAIFDTGVDPGASGLSVTTDGNRKIVDLVDCTSSGDVLMQPANITSENTIQGLSGRVLRIPSSVVAANPNAQYRIGIKAAYDFFPRGLIRRVKRERQDARNRKHRALVAQVRLALSKLKDGNESAKSNPKKDSEIDEMEARLEYLTSVQEKYIDSGPIFDCVVFKDTKMGNIWRAIVDTSECGNLDECDVMEDFVINGSYSQFPRGFLLNFATNIYEDGARLSIVVDTGSHGTHVAGIVAANFPDAPHLNGLAPNARIVSLKIGDSRLSGMETHQGVMRAVAYCLAHSSKKPLNFGVVQTSQDSTISDLITSTAGSTSSNSAQQVSSAKDISTNPVKTNNISTTSLNSSSSSSSNAATTKTEEYSATQSSTEKDTATHPSSRETLKCPQVTVDIINMSYGEHTADPDKGRFIDLVNDLVRKHDVIFVSSAGNEGPAFTSASAPGGTTSSIIGVSALFTSKMARQAYGLLDFEFGDSSASVPSSLSATPMTEPGPIPTPKKSDGLSSLNGAMDTTPVFGTPYTWSSRGPVSTGALGVCVTAPGGAIAPIPQWNLHIKQLMNGTSMSSPSAAGTIAVILSFLKARRIPYTSALVRRAIENTARQVNMMHQLPEATVDDSGLDERRQMKFSVGHGCIDGFSASSYIESYLAPRKRLTNETSDEPYLNPLEDTGDFSRCLENWHMEVTLEKTSPKEAKSAVGNLKTKSGIYLRGFTDTEDVHRVLALVNIVGLDNDDVKVKAILSKMEVYVGLTCDSDWVKIPSYSMFDGAGSKFSIVVDPTVLAPGRAYFTEIIGRVKYSTGGAPNGEGNFGGPLFRVPISVMKPEPLLDDTMIRPIENVEFVPGLTCRRFYEAPQTATFALLRVTAGSDFINDPSEQASPEAQKANDENALHTPVFNSNSAGYNLYDGRMQNSMISATSSVKSMVSGKKESLPIDDTGVNDSDMPKSGSVRKFDVHILQVTPKTHVGRTGFNKYMTFNAGCVHEMIVPIIGGCMFELCVAQLVTSGGRCKMSKIEMSFGGLIPRPASLMTNSAALTFPSLHVCCDLKPSNAISHNLSALHPRATLTHVFSTVGAKSTKITRRYDRHDDILHHSENGDVGTYELQMDFTFEAHDECGGVSLHFIGLNEVVYEATLDGGPFVNLFDANKRFLGSSDIYPSKFSLDKGEYHASAYLRSSDLEMLEKIRKSISLNVKRDFKTPITVNAFPTKQAACFSSGTKLSSFSPMAYGERRAVYFSPPARSAFPKWVSIGDVAIGSFTVDKLNTSNSWSKKCTDLPSYPLTLTITTTESKGSSSPSKSAKSGGSKSPSTESEDNKKDENSSSDKAKDAIKSETEQSEKDADAEKWMEEELKKLYLKQLKSTVDDSNESRFSKLFKFVSDKYPDDLEVLECKLRWCDMQACRQWNEIKSEQSSKQQRQKDAKGGDMQLNATMLKTLGERVTAVCEALKPVLAALDEDEIARHFAYNVDKSDQSMLDAREKFEKKRQQLVDALFRRARALSLLFLIPVASVRPFDTEPQYTFTLGVDAGDEQTKKWNSEFEAAMKHLAKWVALDGKGSLYGATSQGTAPGSVSNEQLAVLAVVTDARKQHFGCALRTLTNFYGLNATKRLDSEWIAQIRFDLIKALKWQYLIDEQCEERERRFPKSVMLY